MCMMLVVGVLTDIEEGRKVKVQEKKEKELKNWHWPYLRYSDGPEYACPHGIGHSKGVHGCDGCCANARFKRISKRRNRV